VPKPKVSAGHWKIETELESIGFKGEYAIWMLTGDTNKVGTG
jgi:hypothetical protein